MHHQQVGTGRKHGDRHEVPDRVVIEFGIEAGVDTERRGTEEQRIAVGRLANDEFGSDVLRLAGAVFDNGLLAQRLGNLRRDQPAHDVAAADGCVTHDHADGLGRILLLRGSKSAAAQHRDQRAHQLLLHVLFVGYGLQYICYGLPR